MSAALYRQAEEIVRALAECEAPMAYDQPDLIKSCSLCGEFEDAEHASDCPWLMAQAWVEREKAKKARGSSFIGTYSPNYGGG